MELLGTFLITRAALCTLNVVLASNLQNLARFPSQLTAFLPSAFTVLESSPPLSHTDLASILAILPINCGNLGKLLVLVPSLPNLINEDQLISIYLKVLLEGWHDQLPGT